MRKTTKLVTLLGGSLLALSMQTTFADAVPTSMSPMSTILQKLQTQGYVNIQKIEFEDEKYEVKVIDSHGRREKLEVNPQTGEVLNAPKTPKAYITALEVAKKVEAAGYHNLYKMKIDDDKYEVKALDSNGKKVSLDVDATTGKVTKD